MKNRVSIASLSVAGVMALIPAGASWAQTLQAVRGGNRLVTVNSTAPGTILRSMAVTGSGAGQTISGIDYRPAAPRILYAISNVGQLYTINARTGVATVVGTDFAVGGVAVRPQLHGRWYHEFRDRTQMINASITNTRLSTATFGFDATRLAF